MMAVAQLGDVAPAKALKRSDVFPDEVTWHLNLDQVESQSGRVLEEIVAPVADAGNSTHWFDERHVLYSKLRPYLNKVVVPERQGIATTELVPMVPDPTRLDRKYLAHYLRSNQFVSWISDQIAGAKMPRVSMKILWSHEIPLPPLAEQKRITAILDKADAIRKKRQQAIALTEDFLRSAFLEMFGDPVTNQKGWKTKTLKALSTRFSDGPFGSNLKSSHYVESGVRVVRLQNIAVGEFVDKAKAYISGEHFDTLRKHECLSGDVIIGTMGEPNLRACILPGHIEFALNKADCIQMRIDRKKCTPEYVLYLINHPGTLALASHMLHGQTRVRVSMGTLRELAVPVPDLKVQEKFSELVLASKKISRKQVGAGTHAEENFNSLVQRAFRGEL